MQYTLGKEGRKKWGHKRALHTLTVTDHEHPGKRTVSSSLPEGSQGPGGGT